MTVIDNVQQDGTAASGPDLAAVMTRLRRTYASGKTRPLGWRLQQLAGIERLVDERESEIAQALAEDLGRSAPEAWLGDIASTKGEAAYASKHLTSWMKKKRARIPVAQMPGRAWVQHEPLGVVLVIGPWNYPVYLSLGPLIAAVAAGNCAVIKPSELAPATSTLLARLIPQYVDSEAVAVVEGDGGTTQELLALGFDHALFTGGTEIGRKIMQGAAATLTPVTLELGGKSPVVVTADADLDVAARRIAWVKLMNSGQTCIAPDYVIVDRTVRDVLVQKVVDAMTQFSVDENPNGRRIVNERQFDRLASYLAQTQGTIATGGTSDRAQLLLQPTVVVEPGRDEALMTEEVFGPILPVISYGTLDEVITFVNSRPKPLALYVFASSKTAKSRLVEEIAAGGAVINHIAMHCLVPQLPFGGVGDSGMGAYHGEWGYQTLSHRKAVLSKSSKPDPGMFYPPYTEKALKIMRKVF